jgi:hypothetical protein
VAHVEIPHDERERLRAEVRAELANEKKPGFWARLLRRD